MNKLDKYINCFLTLLLNGTNTFIRYRNICDLIIPRT